MFWLYKCTQGCSPPPPPPSLLVSYAYVSCQKTIVMAIWSVHCHCPYYTQMWSWWRAVNSIWGQLRERGYLKLTVIEQLEAHKKVIRVSIMSLLCTCMSLTWWQWSWLSYRPVNLGIVYTFRILLNLNRKAQMGEISCCSNLNLLSKFYNVS